MHFLYVFVFFSHHIFIILITAQNNTHLSLSLFFLKSPSLQNRKKHYRCFRLRNTKHSSCYHSPTQLFYVFLSTGQVTCRITSAPAGYLFTHTVTSHSHSLLLRAQFHFILQRSTHHVLPNKNLAVMSFSFKADLVQSPLQDNNQPHSRRPRLARTHTQHRPLIPLTAASSFLLTIGGETIHSTPLTAENLFFIIFIELYPPFGGETFLTLLLFGGETSLNLLRWRNRLNPP